MHRSAATHLLQSTCTKCVPVRYSHLWFTTREGGNRSYPRGLITVLGLRYRSDRPPFGSPATYISRPVGFASPPRGGFAFVEVASSSVELHECYAGKRVEKYILVRARERFSDNVRDTGLGLGNPRPPTGPSKARRPTRGCAPSCPGWCGRRTRGRVRGGRWLLIGSSRAGDCLASLPQAPSACRHGGMTGRGGLGFVAGRLLAQRSRWRVVEVDPRQLGDAPFELSVELILRLREHGKRVGEVGALYVGEQQISLRRVLQVPRLLGDVYAPLGGCVLALALGLQYLEEGARPPFCLPTPATREWADGPRRGAGRRD